MYAADPATGRNLATLVPFVAAVAVVAVLGAVAAGSAGDTYAALERPAFAPPSWLFGPVWTVLYVMIAVSGWLLWRADGPGVAMALWGAQLAANLLWTPLFFGADRYAWALVDIVVLWVLIVALTVVAWNRSRPAALLLVPYLAWVTFAAALNAEIVRLN